MSTIKKKRKPKWRSRSERLIMLKKRFKSYMKKKKKQKDKQQRCQSNVQSIPNNPVQDPSQSSESSLQEHPTMIDFQFVPDLSKRKYIYKDITLSNQNPNQINWVSLISRFTIDYISRVVFSSSSESFNALNNLHQYLLVQILLTVHEKDFSGND